MNTALLIPVVLVVVFGLVFDFTNGFHDTANAMATSVATGALKPRTAVVIAGVLNLVGAFLSTQVAQTISSGIIKTERGRPRAHHARADLRRPRRRHPLELRAPGTSGCRRARPTRCSAA